MRKPYTTTRRNYLDGNNVVRRTYFDIKPATQSSRTLIINEPEKDAKTKFKKIKITLLKIKILNLKFNTEKGQAIFNLWRIGALGLILVFIASMVFEMGFFNVQAQYQGDSVSGKGIICYSDGTTTPKTRTWGAGSTNFGTTETSTAASEASLQTVIKQNPIRLNEWLCAVADNAGFVDVLLSTDGGLTWSLSLDDVNVGGTGTTRRFDLAYEQLSGDAVLMYSKNATSNEYASRVWAGTSWAAEQVYDIASSADTVTWIEMTEKPRSNDIGIGLLDNGTSTNLAGSYWSGDYNVLDGWKLAYDPGVLTETAGVTKDTTNNVMYSMTVSSGQISRCPTSSSCDAQADWAVSNAIALTGESLNFDSERGILYATTSGTTRVYRCDITTTGSCNDSGDWTNYNSTQTIFDTYIDYANDIMYAGANTGIIYRCNIVSTGCDAWGDWTTALDSTESLFHSFTIDTTNSIIYAGSSAGGMIYRCLISSGCDSDVTDWAVAYDTAETEIRALEFDADNGTLYAASSGSSSPDGLLFRCSIATSGSCDDSGDWTTAFDNNLSGDMLQSLEIDTTNDVLYVGAFAGASAYCLLSSGCNEQTDFRMIDSFNAGVSGNNYAMYYDVGNDDMYASSSSYISRCDTPAGGCQTKTSNLGLCDQTAGTPDGVDKCFDVNYDSAYQMLVITWGISSGGNVAGGVNTITTSFFDESISSSFGWRNFQAAPGNTGDDATWIDCESDPDPTSLLIACGSYGASQQDVQAWTVTVSSSGPTVSNITINLDATAHAASAGRALVAATFLRVPPGNGDIKRGFIAWADTAAAATIHYSTLATFTGAGVWAGAATIATTNATNEESIQVVRNPYNTAEAVIIVTDSAADLFAERISINSAGTLSGAAADNAATLEASGTGTQGFPASFAFEPARSRSTLDQKGYIWENDDEDYAFGDANDENSQLAAGNTSITLPKGAKANLRIQAKNTGGAIQNQNIGLFYDRNDGLWSKIGASKPPDTTNGTGCTDVKWSCGIIESETPTNGGINPAIAIDSSGNPLIVSNQVAGGGIRFARYVGTGGTGCNGSSTEWLCTTINDPANSVDDPSIAIDSAGNPWVAYRNVTNTSLEVARYVGTGGSCSNTAWACTVINDVADSVGSEVVIKIDSMGNPWIVNTNFTDTSIEIARYDGDAVASGCTSAAWTCTVINDTADTLTTPTLAFDNQGLPWISYGNFTNGSLEVARFVGSGGTGCSGTSAWTCMVLFDTADALLNGNSMALDSRGSPVFGYANDTDNTLELARYVGSGGTGCTSAAWTCTVIGAIGLGAYSVNTTTDANSNPVISYKVQSSSQLGVANYVGSGGADCTASAAWTCTTIYNPAYTIDATAIATDNEGRLWIPFFNSTTSKLEISKIDDRAGELLISSSTGAQNGNGINESHVDMSSVTDDSSRNDADCVDGGTWQNGTTTNSEENKINFNGGNSLGHCTEYTYSIDTSQAVAGRTYRIALSSKDNWDTDMNIWRGANTYTQYATVTIADSVFRAGKDNSPKLADCTDTNWGCSTVNDVADNLNESSMAFDSSGNPWISYKNLTDGSLEIAQYVGSGGSCSNTAWTCTVVNDVADNVGNYISTAFDPSGNPWVSYQNSTDGSLEVARYVGSGGSGCTSSAWTCTVVNDVANTLGLYTSMVMDSSGNPWVSYQNSTNGSLEVARYDGDAVASGCTSSAWTCTVVNDVADVLGEYSSIAMDSSNNSWIGYRNFTDGSIEVARYVGSGGSGCTSSAWTCTVVNDVADVLGTDLYMNMGSSNNPTISYYNFTDGSIEVAQYVGSGGSSCSIGATWNCTVVKTGAQNPSVAADTFGNTWISYYNPTNLSLEVARFVTSGGSGCDSGAWTCSSIYDVANTVGDFSSIAISPNGEVWISHNNASTLSIQITKQHRSISPFSLANIYKYKNRNGSTNFGRYKLSPGASPISVDGSCGSAVADYMGLCAMFQNSGNYDTIIAQANESPYLSYAVRYSDTTELPTMQWFGRTNYAPSTGGTAGDIVMQVYRYGSTNAWETVASDTASADCNTPGAGNCSLSGLPSGTSTDYFYNDGAGGQWIYFRLYQEPNTGGTITFKTDQFKAARNEKRMRHGQFFQDEVKRSLNFN